MDSGMDLSALISSVLQNPEITGIISSLGAKETEGKEKEEKPEKEGGAPLEIPPEILAKLPQMMSALSGISGIGSNTPPSPAPTGKEAQRSALLKALRPYMSERRRAALDGILGMESVAKVLGTLKDT